MYLVFRYGEYEGIKDERYYQYMTSKRLKNYIHELRQFKILNMEVLDSFEKGNPLKWLHCLIQKDIAEVQEFQEASKDKTRHENFDKWQELSQEANEGNEW